MFDSKTVSLFMKYHCHVNNYEQLIQVGAENPLKQRPDNKTQHVVSGKHWRHIQSVYCGHIKGTVGDCNPKPFVLYSANISSLFTSALSLSLKMENKENGVDAVATGAVSACAQEQ